MRSKKFAKWLCLVLVVAILFVVTGCRAEEQSQMSETTPTISETKDVLSEEATPTPEVHETFAPQVSSEPEEIPDKKNSVEIKTEPSNDSGLSPVVTPAVQTTAATPTPTPQAVTPQPTPTQAPHEHSYTSSEATAAGCTTEGYTTYFCSCGHSYCDSYIAAPGHSWSEWSITKEATTSSEGEQARTCNLCGASEIQTVAQLPAETINTAELEAYGRSYGASLGFVPSAGLGLNGEVCGYFPPTSGTITDMDQGRQRVANKVYGLYSSLMAMEGSDEAFRAVQCRINVVVTDNGNGNYTLTVYYG